MSKCCDNGNESIEASPYSSSCGCPKTTCGCGCGRAVSSCGCNRQIKQVSLCAEDNKITEYVYAIFGSITSVQAFAMPACAGEVTIEFDHVCNIALGTWLWAEGVGYLEVTAVSNAARTLKLKNLCPSGYDGQADAGDSIPVGTQFVLGQPQLLGSSGSNLNSSLYPYLTSGFLAPNSTDGTNCITVGVTNVNGLAVGKDVAIKTGTYRISAIVSPTSITICNDGAGLTEGVNVDYDDAQGNLVVPVVLIDNNPCTNPTTLSGKVLVCEGGVQKPLIGNQNNQLLVYNHDTGNSNFRTLGVPVVDCTELTSSITLDPGLTPGTPYIINVVSSADFPVTSVVLIGGTEFTVTTVLSGTSLRITPSVHPTAVQTYNVGSTVCGASCCEILDNRLSLIEIRVNANRIDSLNPGVPFFNQIIALGDSVGIAGASLAAPVVGNLATTIFNNASGINDMIVHFDINAYAVYDVAGVAGKYAFVQTDLESGGVVGATPPTPGLFQSLPDTYGVVGATGVNRFGRQYKWTTSATVPPNTQFAFNARLRATQTGGDASSVTVQALNTSVTAYGVAVLH